MKKHLIIALLFISLFGCRSKQKAVNSINEKILIEKTEKLNQQISENFKSDSIANFVSSSSNIFENLNIELIQADSSKTITITMPDGQQTKIKGANVKLIKQKKITQTSDTTSITIKKEAAKTTKTESQSNKSEKTETKKRATQTEIKSTSTWLWITLIIIALALIVAWRLKLFRF